MTPAAVDQMMRKYILWEDPRRIEDRWQAMDRSSFYRDGPRGLGLPVVVGCGGASADAVRSHVRTASRDGR